jgi:glycosyltransferase involved in cell wall biosynthesis
LARGEFIAYLDADDEYQPDYLEQVVAARDQGDVLVFRYDILHEDAEQGSPHPNPLPEGEGTRGPNPGKRGQNYFPLDKGRFSG